MKRILGLIITIVSLSRINAQEEATLNHYVLNPQLLNPATVGVEKDHFDVFLNLRSAWTSFPGAPRTYAVSAQGPVGNRLGLGGLVYTESIASLRRTRAQLAYAFHFGKDDLKASFGLSTEFKAVRLDKNVNTNNQITAGDNKIADATDGERTFDASLGVYAEYKDMVFGGLSFPSLIKTRLDNIEGNLVNSNNFLYTGQIGARWKSDEYKMKLEPSVVLRQARQSPMLIDVNVLGHFLDEQLLAGLSYRHGTGGNLAILLGTKFNIFRFAYSYDIYFGSFQQLSSGTHEITLNLRFDRGGSKNDRARKFR